MIDVYLSIFDKIILDLIGVLGILRFVVNGWYGVVNFVIVNGDVRGEMDKIRFVYEDVFVLYLG